MNDVPHMKIKDASRATGLSCFFIRQSYKDGWCPHVRAGSTYMGNVPARLEKLDEQSREARGNAS